MTRWRPRHITVFFVTLLSLAAFSAMAYEGKVEYLPQVWTRGDGNANFVYENERNRCRVVDDEGKELFALALNQGDRNFERLQCAGDLIYKVSPSRDLKRQWVEFLDTKGKVTKSVPVLPLWNVGVAAGGIIAVWGQSLTTQGKEAAQFAIYSLDGRLLVDSSGLATNPGFAFATALDGKTCAMITPLPRGPFGPGMYLHLFRLDRDEYMMRKVLPLGGDPRSCAFSANRIVFGITLTEGALEDSFYSLDLASYELRKIALPDRILSTASAFIVQGDICVIPGEGTILAWDTRNIKVLWTYRTDPKIGARVASIAGSRDGRSVVVVVGEGYETSPNTVLLIENAQVAQAWHLKPGRNESIKVAADGKTILVFNREYTARLK